MTHTMTHQLRHFATSLAPRAKVHRPSRSEVATAVCLVAAASTFIRLDKKPNSVWPTSCQLCRVHIHNAFPLNGDGSGLTKIKFNTCQPNRPNLVKLINFPVSMTVGCSRASRARFNAQFGGLGLELSPGLSLPRMMMNRQRWPKLIAVSVINKSSLVGPKLLASSQPTTPCPQKNGQSDNLDR